LWQTIHNSRIRGPADLDTRGPSTALPRLDDGVVSGVQYQPGTGRPVVASTDGTLRVWDPARPQSPVMTVPMPSRTAIVQVALSRTVPTRSPPALTTCCGYGASPTGGWRPPCGGLRERQVESRSAVTDG
jgi:hypothetical protein